MNAPAMRHFAVVGFVLALAVLVAVSTTTYRAAQQYLTANRSVQHTLEIEQALTDTLSNMLDLQSGMRGYVISGDERLLAYQSEARATVAAELARLDVLLAADPTQHARLLRLQKLIDQRLLWVDEIVALRRTEGYPAAAALVTERFGGNIAVTLRSVVTTMRQVERSLLQQRLDEAQDGARLTRVSWVAGTALSVAMFVVVFYFLRRENLQRERLEEERNQFFELSLDLLCIAGFDGYFKRLNPAWERTLGFTCAELMAQPFLEFVHPADRQRTATQETQVNTGTPAQAFENRYRCKDGSYRWLAWNAVASSATQRVYAVARDVTEQKAGAQAIQQLNEELQTNAELLAAANHELEAFAYSVSHDLRAPLRSIDGFSRILQEDYRDKLDPAGWGHTERIRAASQRMSQLIDDLLTLSRVTRAELHRQAFDLSELAQGVAGELRAQQPDRAVELRIMPGLVVNADRHLLLVVLENLLSNAWKFTAKKTPACIEVGLAPAVDGRRVFFVADNGAGFDMTYAGKLFNPFQRLHAVSEFPGTGIGLASVQRIIHRHGGRVWVEAAVERGAKFYFTFGKEN